MLDIEADGRIEALRRAMAWARGPTLIFVHVPTGPAREELITRLVSWSGQEEMPEIRVVTLAAAEQPFQRLESLGLDRAKRTAVVLLGLEQYATGEKVSPALARLNFLRDLLPRVVPGPLVLVATDEVYASLLASAPDTFTWRQFEISVRGVGEQAEQEGEARGEAHAFVVGMRGEDAVPEVERLRGLLAGVLARPGGYGENEAAKLRARLGHALAMAYRFEEADAELKSAAAAFRTMPDTRGEAMCIWILGVIKHRRSDHEGARASCEQALPLYRHIGDVRGEANCIKSLGDIAAGRSDDEGARALYAQAQPLYNRVGDVTGEANCIRRLGDIALNRSDHEGARALYEQALLLYGRTGSVWGEASCIMGLGDIARARSDHEGARAFYEQALPLYRDARDVLGGAECIESLGDIALGRSDYERARASYEQALPLYRRSGNVVGEANCILSLGDIARRRSDHEGARGCYEQALRLYEHIPKPYAIGRTHKRLAHLTPDPEVRRHHLDAAREAWTSIGRADLVATLDSP